MNCFICYQELQGSAQICKDSRHQFCVQCLVNMMNLKGENCKLSCPLCLQEITLHKQMNDQHTIVMISLTKLIIKRSEYITETIPIYNYHKATFDYMKKQEKCKLVIQNAMLEFGPIVVQAKNQFHKHISIQGKFVVFSIYNNQEYCVKNFILSANCYQEKGPDFSKSNQDAQYMSDQLIKQRKVKSINIQE